MGNNVHNSTAQETDTTVNPRDEFIKFLDSEISSLRSEIQRPGWTTWAILGGIAALVWLLFSEIEIGKYSVRNVAGLVFVIWLFCVFFMGISSLVNPARPPHKSKERFLPEYLMSTRRLGLILLAGIPIFFIFVAMDFSPDVGSLVTIMAYFVIASWILAIVIFIVIAFTNIPIPRNTAANTQTKIANALSAVVTAIPLWFYIRFLFISPGTASIFDVRFATVIAAISCLVLLLMFKSAGSLTLDSLIAIKRELFLGRLDLDTAKRQVDVALTGLDASQAFEEYLSKLLSLLREAAAEYSKCTEHLERLERLYAEMKSSRTEEQWSEFMSEAFSIRESFQKVLTILKESVPEAFKPLQRRIYIVSVFFSVLFKDSDIFEDMMLKISDAINHLKQQAEDFDKRSNLLVEAVEKDHEAAESG
jgi:hypothetical protein